MPDDVSKAIAYFQGKFAYWASHSDGTVEGYFRGKTREDLAAEFRSDPAFEVVCVAFRKIGELQLRHGIAKSAEGLVGALFNIPLRGELDIIIGGIADACRFETLGDKLLKAGTVAILATAFVSFIVAALGRSG